ncbi:MAG: translation initiation factor 2 [Lachnospiraceae bacterium]|nr:translation initiation factor 2 [Lachnospiraceae bacterium]MDD7177009.1 translation initiation factor 2 [bacterium]MDY5517034.1 translation initiation factor 2 [Lachnospiraceae bacterium]
MKGTYSVTVKNNVLQYQFEIRRNITIIKGDSATGKTTLVDMIREYDQNGEQSGITLTCQKTCVVLEGRQWKVLLENIHDSLVFIDEGNKFITTDEFSTAIKQSDNYYVIVTREGLPNLPYSVEEIYGIKNSGKYGTLQQTYQEFYRIYGDVKNSVSFQADVVLVEDSNAGCDFFESIAEGRSWRVISAGGKSNIYKLLKEHENKRLLVIADGAAFGSEMDKVMKKINMSDRMAIYLPESFEWLILKADVIRDNTVAEILEHPSDFIESRDYMSWERFFTALLVDKTKDTYLRYSKSKLNESYKNQKIQGKILQEIPDQLL